MHEMSRADLSDLWDEHTRYEFSARDLEATLATMVDDAYVNHIPTMTGGYGKKALRIFYGQQFIPTIPPDFKLIGISRTIGDDQLVDEMIVTFTHTNEIPWLIPHTPPTNRYVEVPTLAVVHFRDNKLAHEHIYWDQASVLKQIGLLTDPSLPVCGKEAGHKLLEGSRSGR
jgi:carboxymethylenebutenolidase